MNEEIQNYEWSTEINVRFVSSNPIIKILNLIIALFEFITGIRRTGVLAEQGDYLIINTKTKAFWVLDKAESMKKISKNRIACVKVSTEKQWIFFRFICVVIYAAGVNDEVLYEVKVPYGEIKDKAESWLS